MADFSFKNSLPHPPLLSSQGLNWAEILLEHHCQPAQQRPEMMLSDYVISIFLGDLVELERASNGQVLHSYITRGNVTIAPPGLHPRMIWHQQGEFILLRLDVKRIAKIMQELATPELIDVIPQFGIIDPLIEQLGLSLKTELEISQADSRYYADSVANLLAVHLLKRYGSINWSIQKYSGGLSQYQLRLAIDFIHAYLTDRLSVAAIANAVGISQYHFARLFKQSMGIPVYRYITQCRIERAKQLLKREKLTIAEISDTIGFADQSHFTRQFKHFVGVTPNEFRQR
ncbi:helix-turn-helix transcriptional regulator [Pleurocapsales cyanobacterium LEGE 06147]|nr:helix-turn-helix transcriptional regulator [Pleurocapsales cyanobacterium LEGE 06147]